MLTYLKLLCWPFWIAIFFNIQLIVNNVQKLQCGNNKLLLSSGKQKPSPTRQIKWLILHWGSYDCFIFKLSLKSRFCVRLSLMLFSPKKIGPIISISLAASFCMYSLKSYDFYVFQCDLQQWSIMKLANQTVANKINQQSQIFCSLLCWLLVWFNFSFRALLEYQASMLIISIWLYFANISSFIWYFSCILLGVKVSARVKA